MAPVVHIIQYIYNYISMYIYMFYMYIYIYTYCILLYIITGAYVIGLLVGRRRGHGALCPSGLGHWGVGAFPQGIYTVHT